MLFWFPAMTLMVETMRVMHLQMIVIRGGDPSLIIDNYRKIIAANIARLLDA